MWQFKRSGGFSSRQHALSGMWVMTKIKSHTRTHTQDTKQTQDQDQSWRSFSQRSFSFLRASFSSSVVFKVGGRKCDMTMRNCSKLISCKEPTSFSCWFLFWKKFLIKTIPVYRESRVQDKNNKIKVTKVQTWRQSLQKVMFSTCFRRQTCVCETWTYAPFVEECVNYLLSDGVVGQGWDAV